MALLNHRELPLGTKVRVRRAGLLRRFLLTDKQLALVGRIGTITLIERSPGSQKPLYCLVFEDRGQLETEEFFANELRRAA